LQKLFVMGVTRLKRKEARNRQKATQRVKDIKRLKSFVTVASPYKEVSGVVIEDDKN
jgi:hypothetical protein